MANQPAPMVLRSFHLPQDTDDDLRSLAHVLRCSKADLLRFFIDNGMRNIICSHGRDWRSWTPETRELVLKGIQAGGASESIKQGQAQDLLRFREATA